VRGREAGWCGRLPAAWWSGGLRVDAVTGSWGVAVGEMPRLGLGSRADEDDDD
jgi:hypothetical protein